MDYLNIAGKSLIVYILQPELPKKVDRNLLMI